MTEFVYPFRLLEKFCKRSIACGRPVGELSSGEVETSPAG